MSSARASTIASMSIQSRGRSNITLNTASPAQSMTGIVRPSNGTTPDVGSDADRETAGH